MASIEELQRQSKQRAEEKANLAKQSQAKSQEEIDNKFNKKKSQQEILNDFKNRNENESESVKKKRGFAAVAFRSAVDSLKSQFEDAKNNPDSIFSPFFEKDKDGNVKNKINYKTVLDKESGIDEFVNSKKELEELKPEVKRLRSRKEKTENALVKNQKVQEDLYPKTSEYKKEVETKEREEKEKQEKDLSDKYLKKGNFVSDIFDTLEKDKYTTANLPVPYNDLYDLVSKDFDKVDEVKNLLDKRIQENINHEERFLELDQVKSGLDSIAKFEKERLSTLNELRNLENESIDFTDQLFNIEEVSRYYGSKDNMSKGFLNRDFSSNFSLIKKFLQDYKANDKKVMDLDLIKQCIQDQKEYMNKFLELKDNNPEKISEYFKSKERGQLYKEIVGKEKPSPYVSGSFYPADVSFGRKMDSKNNISIDEIKNIYETQIQKLNKKGEVVKEFAESSFDLSVKTLKIEKDYNTTPSSLESILKKEKETEISLSNYLQNSIKSIKERNKDKLDQKIILSEYPMMFETDQNDIDALKESVQKIKSQKEEKETEIDSLRAKKLGLFDSKSKHDSLVKDKETELTNLRGDLKNAEEVFRNKRSSIERGDNADIFKSLFNDKDSIYKNFISDNFRDLNTPQTLVEILNKFEVIIDSKLLEMGNKKEENENIEKALKEHQDLFKKFKENKEKVITFYKDSIKDKK